MLENIKFYRKNNYLQSPKIVQIEITNKCPLKCPQCYKSPDAKMMDMKKFASIIDDCSNINVGAIMINGGEPMMNDHFIEMIEYASSKNISTYCFLSGLKFSERVVKRLENLKISVSISLNGIDENVNTLSRDGYEHAIHAIDYLSNSTVDWGINWVARHDNVEDFNNVINYAINKKANFINVIGNKINGKALVSPMVYDDFVLLKDIINKNKDLINIRIETCFSIMLKFMEIKSVPLFDGCMAGIQVCFIDVDGKYHPCSHLYYPESFNNIQDYWENSNILSKLRTIDLSLSEQCRGCSNNSKCRFCRAISYETSINFDLGLSDCPIHTLKGEKYL